MRPKVMTGRAIDCGPSTEPFREMNHAARGSDIQSLKHRC